MAEHADPVTPQGEDDAAPAAPITSSSLLSRVVRWVIEVSVARCLVAIAVLFAIWVHAVQTYQDAMRDPFWLGPAGIPPTPVTATCEIAHAVLAATAMHLLLGPRWRHRSTRRRVVVLVVAVAALCLCVIGVDSAIYDTVRNLGSDLVSHDLVSHRQTSR